MKLLSWMTPSSWRRSALSKSRPHRWSLRNTLLEWSAGEPWSIGDSVDGGLLVLGRTGGGKSSTTGRLTALAMLRAGYGGLVLTSKVSDIREWSMFCRDAGRADDLLIIHPGGPWRFNPFQHEVIRDGAGAGQAENVVNFISAVLELADRGSGGSSGSGRDSDPFWRQATRRMIRNFVGLLILAEGTVSIATLYQAILSAPQSAEHIKSERWRSSVCGQLLRQADQRATTEVQKHDFGLIADFILIEYPGLAEKTRSIIGATFTAMIDVMQRGVLHELFGQDTTFSPKVSEEGKIIVVGLPVKEFGELGLIANVLMKYCWQRSIERRVADESTRPVFLFADEAQHFVTGGDMHYMATCRSAKAANIYLSQNVSNFYAVLSGGGGFEKGKAEADSIFGNLSTRVLHANGDAVTNEWASTQIGRSRQFFINSSNGSSAPDDWWGQLAGFGHESRTRQSNSGISEQIDFEVQPSRFTTLRTGGAQNNFLVDAIVYQSGRRFKSTGRTWLPVTFQQN